MAIVKEEPKYDDFKAARPRLCRDNKIWRGLNVGWGRVTLLFIDADPARRAIHEAVNAKQVDPHTVPDEKR